MPERERYKAEALILKDGLYHLAKNPYGQRHERLIEGNIPDIRSFDVVKHLAFSFSLDTLGYIEDNGDTITYHKKWDPDPEGEVNTLLIHQNKNYLLTYRQRSINNFHQRWVFRLADLKIKGIYPNITENAVVRMSMDEVRAINRKKYWKAVVRVKNYDQSGKLIKASLSYINNRIVIDDVDIPLWKENN